MWIIIRIKAEKATDSPNTFKSVAILKRRNTLNRFLKIVFIRNFILPIILFVLNATDRILIGDIPRFQDHASPNDS